MHRLRIPIVITTALFVTFLGCKSNSSQTKDAVIANEKTSPTAPVPTPETQRGENKPVIITAPAPPASTSNPPSPSSPVPSAANDLQRIQTLLDQGLITPAEYETKRNDLEQIQALLEQNLISPEIYEDKRKVILGEALSPPAASSPPVSSSQPSTAGRLKELQALLDQNLITSEEYETKRQAILNAL